MKITTIPSQHKTQVIDLSRLDGGLNLWELDYRLESNQSPEMRNLWWQDGILQCRDGQIYVYGPSVDQRTDPLPEGVEAWTDLGVGYTCFSELFWDYAFYHIGDKLYCMDMVSDVEPGTNRAVVALISGVPENRGTFFRYNDWLFYKNRGGFYKITYDSRNESLFTAAALADEAYIPVIALNASPESGAGDLYQPENRLSPKKTIQYNAAETTETVTKVGDGSTKTFDIGKTSVDDQLTALDSVYYGATLVSETQYTVDLATGKVTFTSAPPDDVDVTFVIKLGIYIYQLPVTEVDEVCEVVVNGVTKIEGTDYAVNLETGQIVFVTAPPVSTPPVNNTVAVTYSKTNADAYNSIMDCPYATVYGSNSAVVIVLGGCSEQPNAFFWSGNDDRSMNAAYWPMSFYNLAGDSEDGITGFGMQYSTLMVLKERSVGKAEFSVEDVDDRDSISLTYKAVNSKIGCDLPWSIQLIENNVVFCNSTAGVHIICESTSALENNIVCLSRNVNGTAQRPGLLEDVRKVGADLVCSFDDDNRYWLVANGHVYLWDYLLSSWKKPSWFYLTDIPGIAYIRNVDKTYHLDQHGRVTVFSRCFTDYDGAITKVYQFPPQFFDTYDRLKDILYCIFTVRSDTDSVVRIQYQSDYETRYDLTDIRSLSWKLTPRNLAYRCLSVQKFAHVARRKPGCRHIRHFSMRLSNDAVAQDLAIVSAQIYFRYVGRDR